MDRRTGGWTQPLIDPSATPLCETASKKKYRLENKRKIIKNKPVAHRQYMVIGTLALLQLMMFVKVERKQGSGPEGDEVL